MVILKLQMYTARVYVTTKHTQVTAAGQIQRTQQN